MTVTHRHIDAIAAHRFPHGSPVEIVEGRAHLQPDLGKIDGVTKRPWQAGGAVDHEEGDPLRVLTDGGQLSAIAGQSIWTDLRDGKIHKLGGNDGR